MSESIKVVCRFRGGQESEDKWYFDPDGITVKSPAGGRESKTFTYDSVLNSDSTQESAYSEAGRSTVQALLNGFNSTIFAYGQSGSGKTFTMLGPDSVVDAIKDGGADGISLDVQRMYGIIPRAIGDIFEAINRIVEAEGASIELSVQYLEIYNEKIQDLLAIKTPGTMQDLKLREMPNGQMIVVGSEHKSVQSFDDIFMALMDGQRSRAVASTNQNDRSSRSHTIFVISYKQLNTDGSQKTGRLNLVDLAGSERIAKTGATGNTLKEAQKINLSLTSLGLCIKALTDGSAHIPFRDSKLTFFLKDALGGNSKTTLICTASKQLRHLDESVQTLQFASRAKRIQNKAAANVMRSPKEMQLMIEKLKAEISILKAQLMQNGITPNLKAPLKPAGAPPTPQPVQESSLKVSAQVSASSSQQETTQQSNTPSQSEDQEESKDGKKGDVSFNTLLNDSTLSFNPDAVVDAPAKTSGIGQGLKSKKDQKQILELTSKLTEQQIRVTEIEAEFEAFKLRSQTQIIELKDQVDTANQKLEDQPNVQEIYAKIRDGEYTIAQKDQEIEKIIQDFKEQLNKKQEEIVNQQGTITFKDEYIKDIEQQNDEFRSELEKISYETFTQVKNDLFSKDQELDRLADRKQYLPIYETFESETTELMQKYTQQESVIQNLQSMNQELVNKLQDMQEDGSMISQSMASSATEMMGMQSEDNMSLNSGFQGKSSARLSHQPQLVTKRSDMRTSSLPCVNEMEGDDSIIRKEDNGIPSMEDLINEAKNQDKKVSDDMLQPGNMSTLLNTRMEPTRHKAGSFVGRSDKDRDSIAFESNRDSVFESEASSVMVRESNNLDEQASSHISTMRPVRVVDNTRLSALTNQIMELVLDNIKMVHLNKKLVDYCKRQTQQHENVVGSMESKVISTTSVADASSEEVNSLQLELDEMRAKYDNLFKLLENERNQFQRTIREKQYSLRSKVQDLNNQLRSEKQSLVKVEMEKHQQKREVEELSKELAKIKTNEKKLKQELQDLKLKESDTLTKAMLANQQKMKGGKDYQSYLKQNQITQKVNMQSKFMDRSQLNNDNNGRGKQSGGMNASRRSSVLPSLNAFSIAPKQKRQGLNLASSSASMLNTASLQSSTIVQEELEEDLKPDYRAQAIDDLDQLAEDLEFSSEEEKDD